MAVISLFAAQASNATSSASAWTGGQCAVIVSGTFGGGTVKLQVSADNTNWADWADVGNITTASAKSVALPVNVFVRADLAGATAPSINVDLVG